MAKLTIDGKEIEVPDGTSLFEACREARGEARGIEIIGVGRDPAARLQLMAQRYDATGQELLFDWQGKSRKARLNLIGGFQADNVLLAAGLVIAAGADPDEVFDTLPYLRTVRGRMQHAATRENGGSVFVDYAHTPDAVATALQAMRPHVMGRIIVIVGAGGDRDTAKRPLMGQAAAENADLVIVTAHWGEQGTTQPRSFERRQAEAWVAAGADGIFGHHQHVLQPLEFIDGVPVAWGLGNFVWQAYPANSKRTAIAQFVYEPDGRIGACLVPVVIERTGHPVVQDPSAPVCAPGARPTWWTWPAARSGPITWRSATPSLQRLKRR